MTAESPNAATLDPIRPPMSAWLLERGIPIRVAENTKVMDTSMPMIMVAGVRVSG